MSMFLVVNVVRKFCFFADVKILWNFLMLAYFIYVGGGLGGGIQLALILESYHVCLVNGEPRV